MERYLIHHNKFFVLEGNCTHSDTESDGIPEQWAGDVNWDTRDTPYFKQLLERTVTAHLFDDDVGPPSQKVYTQDSQILPHPYSGFEDQRASTSQPDINGSAYNKHVTKKLDDLDDLLED